jgi:TusA-related sulfurtransferase
MSRLVYLLIIALIIFGNTVLNAETKQGRVVNLTGGGLCQNSATTIMIEEVSKLKPGDILTVVIETENKHLIKAAIALEKLPVTFEETTDMDLTRFIIKLK